MRSLRKFFSGKRGIANTDEIENYYGHGARTHKNYGHSHKGDDALHNDVKYGCPMKCEGNKTYDLPGNCPVCNMKLVPVAVQTAH